MSDDEFNNIPDDFADIPDVDWARILAEPSSSDLPSTEEQQYSDLRDVITIPSTPARPASSRSSTDYFEDDYDNLDPSLLAELDRMEEELTEAPQYPTVRGKIT